MWTQACIHRVLCRRPVVLTWKEPSSANALAVRKGLRQPHWPDHNRSTPYSKLEQCSEPVAHSLLVPVLRSQPVGETRGTSLVRVQAGEARHTDSETPGLRFDLCGLSRSTASAFSGRNQEALSPQPLRRPGALPERATVCLDAGPTQVGGDTEVAW